MPDRKKQHFVPQFYMRNFCSNERVRTYQFDQGKEFRPTSISNICYENYFYNEDTEIEEAMSQLEGKWAGILHDVINTQKLDSITEREYYELLMFLTYTHFRTKTVKKESNEFATNTAQLLLELKEFEDEDEEEMRRKAIEAFNSGSLSVEHPGLFHIHELAGLLGYAKVADLQPTLLIDDTGMGFIFSDHPVVLENSKFKSEDEHFIGGLQSQGLQLICPISTECCLFLFDGECYWPSEDRRKIYVSSDTVEGVNRLQMIYGLNGVYYEEHREPEMRVLHDEIREFRNPIRHEFQQLAPDEHMLDTDNDIVMFGRTLSDYQPEFGFLDELNVERRLVRDMELVQLGRELMDNALEDVQGEIW